MKKMQSTRYVGRGMELPCALKAPLSPNLWVFTNQELSERRTFGGFIEAS